MSPPPPRASLSQCESKAKCCHMVSIARLMTDRWKPALSSESSYQEGFNELLQSNAWTKITELGNKVITGRWLHRNADILWYWAKTWWCFVHLYFCDRSALICWDEGQGLCFPLSMVLKTVWPMPHCFSSLLGCLQFTVFQVLKYSEAFHSVFRLRCSVYLPPSLFG